MFGENWNVSTEWVCWCGKSCLPSFRQRTAVFPSSSVTAATELQSTEHWSYQQRLIQRLRKPGRLELLDSLDVAEETPPLGLHYGWVAISYGCCTAVEAIDCALSKQLDVFTVSAPRCVELLSLMVLCAPAPLIWRVSCLLEVSDGLPAASPVTADAV